MRRRIMLCLAKNINGKFTSQRINSINFCSISSGCFECSQRLKFVQSARFAGQAVNNRQYTTPGVKLQASIKKKMTKLTEQERKEILQPLLNVGWTMVNGRDAIYKEFIFEDFNKAFSFMTGSALLAEKMNHHPEWFNVYNKVQVTMSTHDVGGLSSKDIRMAKFMEEQFKHFH